MEPKTTANLLGALATALQDDVLGRISASTGHSGTDAAALVQIANYPDLAIDDLRVPLALSHPGCVRLVDRLEAEGMLGRSPGDDRRRRKLRLTPAGEARAAAVLEARRTVLEQVLAELPADDAATLGRLLQAVLIRLVDGEARASGICRLCDYAACPEEDCPAAIALSG